MHIKTINIQNFRRLKNVEIELEKDISIFVGANNSGKTSASQALQLFLSASRDRFSLHDFSADCWAEINNFGERRENSKLPKMSIDLWFQVGESDLHRVVDLLPSLDWEGSLVGLRVEFGATNEDDLLARFEAAREKARAMAPASDGGTGFEPSPRHLREYLENHLTSEFDLSYYVLNIGPADEAGSGGTKVTAMPLTPDKGRSGKEIIGSLVRVDFLNAQRPLSDGGKGGRSEDLSKCLSRFYKRNLEKRESDYDAISALAVSEGMLNKHLAKVFGPTLDKLRTLGYPGLSNPTLVLKSTLNPAAIMSSHDGARVHYAMGEASLIDTPTLPDKYNGLGFKNLIYMVVELLDLHARWTEVTDDRPPLHLLFIEEPEAHLHAQLQQVFIRKVMDILSIEGDDTTDYASQIVVSTHSAHILYERGFRPIRYFRRQGTALSQYSDVLNLSGFYAKSEAPTRDFLERYLKATHCDLFFADAAILVEGNVERLLLPQMIEMTAPRLRSCYLTILEIGGAFAHRFRELIGFLGITTLVVTDIDSVDGSSHPATEEGDLDDDEGEIETEDEDRGSEDGAPSGKRRKPKACLGDTPDAVTSNQTLLNWLPKKKSIEELLAVEEKERIQQPNNTVRALIRVAYQTRTEVSWNEASRNLVGRTLEEAFAFENIALCQDKKAAQLKLQIRKSKQLALDTLIQKLHDRIKSSSFKKTDFALALLAMDPTDWKVPTYINDGLAWLQDQVAPAQEETSEKAMQPEEAP
jgi:predicted ATP-dependent endonuclease of OLD family